MEYAYDFACKVEQSCRPSPEELSSMIRQLLDGKGWSLGHISVITGVNTTTLFGILNMRQVSLPTVTVRSIWLVWASNFAPAALSHYMFISSWGKWIMPVLSCSDFNKLPLMDRKRVVMALEEVGRAGIRLRLHEVAMMSGVSLSAAKELCRQAGYTPEPEVSDNPEIPEFMLPGSPWMEVRWAYTNMTLAEMLGVSIDLVAERRAFFMALARAGQLTRLLKLCGADETYFTWFAKTKLTPEESAESIGCSSES